MANFVTRNGKLNSLIKKESFLINMGKLFGFRSEKQNLRARNTRQTSKAYFCYRIFSNFELNFLRCQNS